jgi:ubiquinone/menaquinone biosynthesis C-methylase UbiE
VKDVQGVYSGPEGTLWELIMGEQIHIGGFAQSMILAEKAGIGRDERVLDLCSALGAGLRFLARFRGARGAGLDATVKMIETAKARTEEDGLSDRIEYRLGNVEQIPWPDGSFDVVWGEDAWCYVEDKDRMIAEAARVLRRGGRIAFSDWVEGPSGWSDETASRICGFMKFPYVESQVSYGKLLEKHGFRISSSEDCTPHFAECVDLYLKMLTEQLTFDALRIIGWDMDMFQAMGGEMVFMSGKAHAGEFGRCRIVAVKE